MADETFLKTLLTWHRSSASTTIVGAHERWPTRSRSKPRPMVRQPDRCCPDACMGRVTGVPLPPLSCSVKGSRPRLLVRGRYPKIGNSPWRCGDRRPYSPAACSGDRAASSARCSSRIPSISPQSTGSGTTLSHSEILLRWAPRGPTAGPKRHERPCKRFVVPPWRGRGHVVQPPHSDPRHPAAFGRIARKGTFRRRRAAVGSRDLESCLPGSLTMSPRDHQGLARRQGPRSRRTDESARAHWPAAHPQAKRLPDI